MGLETFIDVAWPGYVVGAAWVSVDSGELLSVYL